MNQEIYNAVAAATDHINGANHSGRLYITALRERARPFDEYFNMTPPPLFIEIMGGAINIQLNHFFEYFSAFDTTGIILPRDLKSRQKLAAVTVPQFIKDLEKLYSKQLSDQRKKLKHIKAALDNCSNPTDIATIANILRVK